MKTRIQPRENGVVSAKQIKQPILSESKEVKILNLAVHLEKLTVQLSDGRQLSIPID
jgi:hypothetical protein